MKSGLLYLTGAIAVATAVGVLTVRGPRTQPETPAAPAAGTVAAAVPATADPSCKPVPPVRVTLAPGAADGLWRVHVEAIEKTDAVRVEMGIAAGESETARRTVWEGALDAGTARDFDVALPLTATATRVWAAANADPGMHGALRSVSVLEAENGKVTAGKPAAAGRLVTDPNTGETVIEFDGVQGGAR